MTYFKGRMILVYLTKAFSHSILERNSLFIDISLLIVDIISQKPPFFNILRLILTFFTNTDNKKQKNKPTKCTEPKKLDSIN